MSLQPPREQGPVGLLHDARPDGVVDASRRVWGFGGVHGGLTLASLTRAMRAEVPTEARERALTARFHRRINGAFGTQTRVVRAGRTITIEAQATVDGEVHAHATGTFATTQASAAGRHRDFGAQAPPAPDPEDCEPLTIPADFVPISSYMEVRPVGPNRPYAGGQEPALTAWIRLSEDDEPPTPLRLLVLLDALAPSYAAVLDRPRTIPTTELSVRIVNPPRSPSPWALLHAQTTWARADGWLEEHIDAWDPTGVYLASATQLRRLRDEKRPAVGDCSPERAS